MIILKYKSIGSNSHHYCLICTGFINLRFKFLPLQLSNIKQDEVSYPYTGSLYTDYVLGEDMSGTKTSLISRLRAL